MGISTALFGQYKASDYTTPPTSIEQFNDIHQNICPIVSEDGMTMWFTKISTPENPNEKVNQDVWVSSFSGGEWSDPIDDEGNLNTELNDLVVGISQNMIYVLRFEPEGGSQLSTILAFKRIGKTYKRDHVIQLPLLSFQSRFFGFHVNRAENAVVISMKGKDSFGKEDLYVSLKRGGLWTLPIHMGARINSIGFEMSPYLAPDGRHLYFASEEHGSYGSGDIFVSVRLDDTWQNWSRPRNLGPNINTNDFEAYFSLNPASSKAVFISNRNDLVGAIYSIPYKMSSGDLSVSAHRVASGFIRAEKLPAINVKLNLVDENDEIIQSITADDEGYFNLQSFLPDRDYKLAIDESVREELKDADIFLANDLGEQMVFMNEEELGIFGFKVLSGQKLKATSELEALARSGKVVDTPTKISGKVESFGTLKDQVKLNVLDENSEVVETIVTDENGYFEFDTDAKQKSYFLSVDEDLEGLVDVYEIYLTNDNPEEDIVVTKTDKHLFEFRSLISGQSSGLDPITAIDYGMPEHFFERMGLIPQDSEDYLRGYLKFDKLPMINTEVVLMDENDEILGTVMTDDEGMFAFDAELMAGDYLLKLTGEQEETLDRSEIYLAKNPTDMLMYLNDDRAGVFAFKKLTQRDPMTLYSLRSRTESGFVVTDSMTSLKGKFQYKMLPEQGVTLKLLDDKENIIQVTEVDSSGRFEFENYTVNKNYFISVESQGLADIYEIYLSGQQKNVLVNRTDKFVFSFRVLPSQDVMLVEAYESDPEFGGIISDNGERKRAYYEFDLDALAKNEYKEFDYIVPEIQAGVQVVVRLFKEQSFDDKHVDLNTLDPNEANGAIKAFNSRGVSTELMNVRSNGSDQILLIIDPRKRPLGQSEEP